MVNVLTSLVGNVFGFKALKHLRLESIRFPIAYIKTCGGPPAGIQVERDRGQAVAVRCSAPPSSRSCVSAKKLRARRLRMSLRGRLDMTKDDENVNSQPFMRWRDRFEFVGEAIQKAEQETGERKGRPERPPPRRKKCTSVPSSRRRGLSDPDATPDRWFHCQHGSGQLVP